jgi:predicted dehydrogenase
MRVALLEASHWHVPLYLAALERPGVEVVAVSDREAVKGQGIAERFGCPLYQSYRELLERTKIDFAFVFGRHVDMPVIGGALIDRHIPFAIEKPCGTTATSVATLRARAESAGLYVAVPFIFRVSELVNAIRDAEGTLPTRLHHASFRFVVGPPSRYVASGSAWMLDPTQAGGGCTINVGTHFIDMFRMLTGEDVKTVAAVMNTRGHRGDIEDYSVLVMTAADGTVGTVETGYTFPSGKIEQREFSFAMSSDANYYRSSAAGMSVSRRRDPEDVRTTTVSVGLDTDPYYGTFVDRALADVRAGVPPVAGLGEAEAVMRVLDAAYASARLGGRPQNVS